VHRAASISLDQASDNQKRHGRRERGHHGADQEITGVPEEWPCGAVAIGVSPTRWNRNDSGEHVSAKYKTVQLYAADVANCARKNGGNRKGLQSGGHLDQAESKGRREQALADEAAPPRGE